MTGEKSQFMSAYGSLNTPVPKEGSLVGGVFLSKLPLL